MHLKLACLKTTSVNNRTTSSKNNLRKLGQLTTWVEPELLQSKMQSRCEFTEKIKFAMKLNTSDLSSVPCNLRKHDSF